MTRATKCPPVFLASALENQFGGEECKVPSSKEDIIIVDGFLLDIHQSLKISCRNENCDEEVHLEQLENHEKGRKEETIKALCSLELRIMEDLFEVVEELSSWWFIIRGKVLLRSNIHQLQTSPTLEKLQTSPTLDQLRTSPTLDKSGPPHS